MRYAIRWFKCKLKPPKKPNTSAYGRVTDVGGKCPKHLFKGIGEASDSGTSPKSKRDDRESHSDSLTLTDSSPI